MNITENHWKRESQRVNFRTRTNLYALDWLDEGEKPDDEDMKKIEEGLVELDRGEARPADEVFRELRVKYLGAN